MTRVPSLWGTCCSLFLACPVPWESETYRGELPHAPGAQAVTPEGWDKGSCRRAGQRGEEAGQGGQGRVMTVPLVTRTLMAASHLLLIPA